MALQTSSVYHKMQAVFSLFEEGKLKGQNARVMIGLNLQKALEGPKLHNFKIFQGIDVSVMTMNANLDVYNLDVYNLDVNNFLYRMLRKKIF